LQTTTLLGRKLMNKLKKQLLGLAGASLLAIGAAPAYASLAPFQTYSGNVSLSTDGVSDGGSLTANIPSGSTIVAAYLYTAGYGGGGTSTTLNSVIPTYGPQVPNATACCGLASYRADVTSILTSAYDGRASGIYSLTYSEDGGQAAAIDGSALVVVYSNAALPTATVAILDGFASVSGDVANINFAEALNPADPGFFVDMRLGINFSCCSQRSTVNVNGTLITENAGNFDDGLAQQNGQLFTMGGDDDAYSALLPSYADDHERYNLANYVTAGDTTITVQTANASRDDNIFLATFYVSGLAAVNEPPPPPTNVPEPGTLALLGAALLGMGFRKVRAKRA
jgi:hypothetical protein